MKRRFPLICCFAVLCLATLVSGGWGQTSPAPARGAAAPLVVGTEALPPGVVIQTVLDALHQPVAMAFDPQGRLFYTEKDTGYVRLFAGGTLQPDPVITFHVNAAGERGLLGIAVDPGFSQNHYLYVYYTCWVGPDCPTLENRVARFVEHNGVGTNPTTIFAAPATAPAGNHNGGNIHFGPDGKLYITIGDNANAANSQDVTVPNGKMHRINPDGSMPTDNPHFNGPGALPSLYARGLRNSFDFTFDPVVPGRIFASENGPACDDEMNRIEAGYNYGWRAGYPCDDTSPGGPDPQYNTIPPLWTVGQQCCVAPTGITVYTGNQIPQWHNDLFMADYQGPGPYHFYLNADRTALTAANTITGLGTGLDLETGPDGALWYMDGGGNGDAVLRRLVGPGAPAPSTPSTTPSAPPIAPTAPPAPGTPSPPTTPVVPGSGSRLFPETGQRVTGIFLDYWTGHGGLAQQGFPISPLLTEVSDLNHTSYTVQYFERAVFEYHPENQAPYTVLLSQLGTFRYKAKYGDAGAPGQHVSTVQPRVFPETRHTVGGAFRAYWESHGGLAQQGYPISDEFTEVSDLNQQPYLVQYFERAVFEWHPENAPPYNVLLSQLGTFRWKAQYGNP